MTPCSQHGTALQTDTCRECHESAIEMFMRQQVQDANRAMRDPLGFIVRKMKMEFLDLTH